MKISVLQWNLNGHRGDSIRAIERFAILDELVAAHRPSIVLLQECGREVLEWHQNAYWGVAHQETPGTVTLFAREDWRQHPTDDRSESGNSLRVAVLSRKVKCALIVWNVHLPSRLFRQDAEIAVAARSLAGVIDQVRTRPHFRGVFQLVGGDFNLQPFDEVMDERTGLQATRSLAQAQRHRSDSQRNPLFNPSWSLLGALTPPQGTFYYSNGFRGPWFAYDQILASPEIASNPPQGVVVLTGVGSQSLVASRTGGPDRRIGSDHFPVLSFFVLP